LSKSLILVNYNYTENSAVRKRQKNIPASLGALYQFGKVITRRFLICTGISRNSRNKSAHPNVRKAVTKNERNLIMSDNTQIPPEVAPEVTPNTAHNESLLDELRSLGTQLEAVARAFLNSNQAHQIQQDLQKGVGEVVDRLQALRSNEKVTEVSEKGKQFVEKAMENPTVTEAHTKVVSGLAGINEELRKLAASLGENRHKGE
jgi:hypothetical protein